MIVDYLDSTNIYKYVFHWQERGEAIKKTLEGEKKMKNEQDEAEREKEKAEKPDDEDLDDEELDDDAGEAAPVVRTLLVYSAKWCCPGTWISLAVALL